MINAEQEQKLLLSRVDVEHIPRGASVPVELLLDRLQPGARVAEFGGGSGKKAASLMGYGAYVHSFDINIAAVESARQLGVASYVADVSDVTAMREGRLPIRESYYDLIIMEGLLCNLMGTSLDRTLIVAQQALRPGGILAIADVQAADEVNPLMMHSLGARAYLAWQKDWMTRYNNNRKVGLADKHFIVCSISDPLRKNFEWGDPDRLRSLLEKKQFERFARHISLRQLQTNLGYLGFDGIFGYYTMWASRTRAALAGFVGLWEKRNQLLLESNQMN
ncbi:methyltransferase domain-containing protein [Candidatus Gottesmanbacteria bacterium]|nr:methyltransferase domain-containing protein [Candidatus Gottesmanbacteria bacterium]